VYLRHCQMARNGSRHASDSIFQTRRSRWLGSSE
jgi:hypothetical protein